MLEYQDKVLRQAGYIIMRLNEQEYRALNALFVSMASRLGWGGKYTKEEDFAFLLEKAGWVVRRSELAIERIEHD